MSRRDSLIEVEYGELLHETDNAILFDFEGEEIWIPRSLIDSHDASNQLVEIPLWFAEQKGIV